MNHFDCARGDQKGKIQIQIILAPKSQELLRRVNLIN